MMFLPAIELPMTIVKSDGSFTYDASDMTTIKQRLKEENADWLIYGIDSSQVSNPKCFQICASSSRCCICNRSLLVPDKPAELWGRIRESIIWHSVSSLVKTCRVTETDWMNQVCSCFACIQGRNWKFEPVKQFNYEICSMKVSNDRWRSWNRRNEMK